MKKFTIITVIAALTFAVTAFAGPGMGWRGDCSFDGPRHSGQRGACMRGPSGQDGPGPRLILRLADDLELTDDQVSRLEALQTQFSKDMVDRRADVQKAQIELRSLRRDKATESDVNAAIDKMTRLQAENMKTRYRHRQQVESLLTEQQLDKLEEIGRKGLRDGDGVKGKRRGDRDKFGGGPGYGRNFDNN